MLHLALVLGMAAQENQAEELFKKLEKKFAEAKSVTLGFKLDMVDKRTKEEEKKSAVEGTIRAKSGDRFIMDVTIRDKGEDDKFFARSDGKTLRIRSGDRPEKEEKYPKGMSRFLTGATIRSGVFVLQSMGREEAPDPAEYLKVSDFSMNEGGRVEVKVVMYTLTVDGKKASVSLWLDTEKLVPVQRKVRIEGDEGRIMTFEEHYTKVSTDEVPDAEFEHGK